VAACHLVLEHVYFLLEGLLLHLDLFGVDKLALEVLHGAVRLSRLLVELDLKGGECQVNQHEPAILAAG